MDMFSKHLRYSRHFPSEQYPHNWKYNKKESRIVCQFCKEKWSELIHVPKFYAFNAGFFLWVSVLSWRISFAVLCSTYGCVLLNHQIKKVQRRRKKPTTFTCYDLLSKWFWCWAGIHSSLWIIYLHYWVSQWIHKIDVQMRDSKCDELLSHKGSQSLSASVQSERQGLQACWEVSKQCFLLLLAIPLGKGNDIGQQTQVLS